MTSMTVTLRPMTSGEFESIMEPEFARFVEKLVETGQVAAVDAPAEAERTRERTLPNGMATEHMLFFVGEVDGERIGWIWVALPGAPHHADTAWVYNVVVDEPFRGKGFGRGLMTAVEREVVRAGATKIGLNVFGDNTNAVGLYVSLGYEVLAQQMSKPL